MSKEKTIKEILNFGIILIDKPSGPTSFSVSEFVKKKLSKFGIKKTSHFGTLDPKVTGMLPIALGRSCRLTGFFLGEDKEYVGILHTHKEQDIKNLQKLIDENFVGKIKQTPPHKSAVKRQERIREVKRWDLLEESEDKKDFLFVTEVEGGTYIRKLCSDLGEMKDVGGAHMLELRRIRAGIFSEKGDFGDKFVNLYEFENALEEYEKGNEDELRKFVIPAENAIRKVMEVVELKDKSVLKSLAAGKPLFKKDIAKIPSSKVFALFFNGVFVGIYEKSGEKVTKRESEQSSRHSTIGRPKFVFN